MHKPNTLCGALLIVLTSSKSKISMPVSIITESIVNDEEFLVQNKEESGNDIKYFTVRPYNIVN